MPRGGHFVRYVVLFAWPESSMQNAHLVFLENQNVKMTL
jgi:hypothetical protein